MLPLTWFRSTSNTTSNTISISIPPQICCKCVFVGNFKQWHFRDMANNIGLRGLNYLQHHWTVTLSRYHVKYNELVKAPSAIVYLDWWTSIFLEKNTKEELSGVLGCH
jgi:hypothetical protein